MKKILSHLGLIAAMLFLSIAASLALIQYKQRYINTDTSTIPSHAAPQQTNNALNNTPDTPTGVSRPQSLQEAMNRAKLLENKGYFSLALTEYETALKNNPGNNDVLIAVGNLSLRQQDIPKANTFFRQVLQLNPQSIDANLGLVKGLLVQRKIDEAGQLLNTMTAHNQTSRLYQAMVAAAKGDHDTAKNIFKDIAAQPENDDLKAKAEGFLAAYAEFASYAEGDPLHLQVLLSRAYNNAQAYDLSIYLLLGVVKSKTDYRDAWILMGYAYLNEEKFLDARDALEAALKLDPDKSETSFFLGITYYGLKDLEKAAQYLELAKKKGYEPVIQINQKLAEIYLQLKDYKKSADNYEDILALNTTDVNYFIKPLWIYVDVLKEPEKAVALAQKAVKAHPDKAMSYNLLGWAFLANGQLNEAQRYLDQAKRLDPNLDAVYLNYGVLYEQQGHLDAALASFKKAYQIGNGDSISQAAAANYNRVKENFQQSLKANVMGGAL